VFALEDDILESELIEPLLEEAEDDMFDRKPDELNLPPEIRTLEATSPLEEIRIWRMDIGVVVITHKRQC